MLQRSRTGGLRCRADGRSVVPAQPVVFDALNAAMTGGRWEFVEGGWTLGVGSSRDADVATYSVAHVERSRA